jgi:hypothetical protein
MTEELDIDIFTLVKLAAQYSIGNTPTPAQMQKIRSYISERFGQEDRGKLNEFMLTNEARPILEKIAVIDNFKTREQQDKVLEYIARELVAKVNPELADRLDMREVRRHIMNLGVVDQYRCPAPTRQSNVPLDLLRYDKGLAKSVIAGSFRKRIETSPDASSEALSKTVDDLKDQLIEGAKNQK